MVFLSNLAAQCAVVHRGEIEMTAWKGACQKSATSLYSSCRLRRCRLWAGRRPSASQEEKNPGRVHGCAVHCNGTHAGHGGPIEIIVWRYADFKVVRFVTNLGTSAVRRPGSVHTSNRSPFAEPGDEVRLADEAFDIVFKEKKQADAREIRNVLERLWQRIISSCLEIPL